MTWLGCFSRHFVRSIALTLCIPSKKQASHLENALGCPGLSFLQRMCRKKRREVMGIRGKGEAARNAFSIHSGNTCFLTREPLCSSGRCGMEKYIQGLAAFPRQRGYLCSRKAADFWRAPQGWEKTEEMLLSLTLI